MGGGVEQGTDADAGCSARLIARRAAWSPPQELQQLVYSSAQQYQRTDLVITPVTVTAEILRSSSGIINSCIVAATPLGH